MKRKLFCAAAALIGAVLPAAASARTIVLSNDDGLTSNVIALYKELKAAGHDVVVSVPCQNQSGMGAAINVARPLTPLKQACRNGAAKIGDPAVGPVQHEGVTAEDVYYVDGTPVMALFYGIDVVGEARWGKAPDLVLSGPNEGQNLGAVIISSGTVSNAQAAAIRGIPAVAFSAGMNTTGDEALANPASGEVARRAVELVDALDKASSGGAMLPAHTALNVNFPDKLEGAKWRLSKIGSFNAYTIRFVENMKESASPAMASMAKQAGMDLPPLPGLGIDLNNAEPTAEQANDESVVYRTAIAVSPMQAGYERAQGDWASAKLGSLFAGK